MRYWHPFSDAAARAVRAWRPDQVVLLPLYPQYSTTTTGSSVAAWHEAAAQGRAGSGRPIRSVATPPIRLSSLRLPLAADGPCSRRGRVWRLGTPLRVLFSAHGLPESIVASGDPYQWQVEQTVAAVLAAWREPSGRLGDLLPVARDAGALARTEHHCRDRARRAGQGRRACWYPLPSSPSIPKPWSSSTSSIGISRIGLVFPATFRVPTPNADAAFIAALAGDRAPCPVRRAWASTAMRGSRSAPGDTAAARAARTIGLLCARRFL